METKVCTGCKEDKSIDAFGMKSGRKNSRCKACINSYYKNTYYANPDRKAYVQKTVKKYREENKTRILAKKYGLTEEELAEHYDKYDGKCHICKTAEATVVDHCHESNVVRGVLCKNHNVGLGFFGDNVEGLQKAIDYINAAVSPLADNE